MTCRFVFLLSISNPVMTPHKISIHFSLKLLSDEQKRNFVCSFLHYQYGYNVAVIDCDECQASISKMRERDREVNTATPENIEKLKNYFHQLGKKAYPIIRSSLSEALQTAEQLIKESEMPLDFIFFDFPGSVGPQAMLPTIAGSFSRLLIDHIISPGDQRLKGIYLFWNQVDNRESSYLYEVYDEYLEKEQIPLMKVFLPKQVRFSREQTFNKGAFFRSSYFIPDKCYLKESNIEAFVAELLQIISNSQKQ